MVPEDLIVSISVDAQLAIERIPSKARVAY